MATKFTSAADNISRALYLECQGQIAARRWPESPKIAARLFAAARYRRLKAHALTQAAA